jgi:hypothetical protein
MIDVDRRRRWRRQRQFKLYANRAKAKIRINCSILQELPEFFAEWIRIQNLRFAQLLCAAQELSMGSKI